MVYFDRRKCNITFGSVRIVAAFLGLVAVVLLFFCELEQKKLAECSYNPTKELSPEFLYCFREAFSFLRSTTDVSPFHSEPLFSNGHLQRHTIKGIEWLDENVAPIPIILITHNRITVLLETIRSFHRYIKTPFEIVIHDEGSSYPALVAFLKMLEMSGVKVFRAPPKKKTEIESEYPLGYLVARVAKTVEQVLKVSNSSVYVVSDPDCALDSAPGHILEVYRHALNVMPAVKGVGASIRIDDVPKSFLKESKEWQEPKAQEFFLYDDYPIRFSRRTVDTTFCMYRRSFRFDRMQGSVRLEMPFGVRHLDFYFESLEKSPPDVKSYLASNKLGISHASNYIK